MAFNHPPPPPPPIQRQPLPTVPDPLQRHPLATVPETPDTEERQLKRDVTVTKTDEEAKFDFAAVNVLKEEKTPNVLAEAKKAAEVKVNPRKRKAV